MGATSGGVCVYVHAGVSIHAPVMGATKLGVKLHMLGLRVSIHAPVMGATNRGCPYCLVKDSFNPRTRDGCDRAYGGVLTRRCAVSIHAPVMGATKLSFFNVLPPRVSIHAPVMGATNIQRVVEILPDIVSIHAPVMGATSKLNRGGNGPKVSIHAPVMGATEESLKSRADANGFNPRTRDGCDLEPVSELFAQSGFNPRTRDGCDRYAHAWPDGQCSVSIHAPVMGATGHRLYVQNHTTCFNPRTRDGCDRRR